MKSQRSKNNRIEFSKAIVIFAAIVFVITLIVVFNAKMDFAANVTAVSSTGSILLTTIVAYLRKASMENIRKVMIGYYKQTMKVRLNYNERMMKLQKEYGYGPMDVQQLETESPMDQVTENALNDGGAKLQTHADDAQAMPEINNV